MGDVEDQGSIFWEPEIHLFKAADWSRARSQSGCKWASAWGLQKMSKLSQAACSRWV